MADNVTQDQLNSQLMLLHGVMRDTTERNDRNMSKVLDQLTVIAKESRDTRVEILTMTREHAVEIDNLSVRATEMNKRLNGVYEAIEPIKKQLTKNTVYWTITGTVLTAILGCVIKLIFAL